MRIMGIDEGLKSWSVEGSGPEKKEWRSRDPSSRRPIWNARGALVAPQK
jgi:hypothetical protein